jgi:3-dehydroquinate dehydratase II
MANTSAETIYVLNSPNLDSLGTASEPEVDGHADVADVERLCADTAGHFGLKTDCRRSSRESELIDLIREADANKAAGIVVNAGRYSHTSIALQDALARLKIPAVEVHIGNLHAHQSFRHQSFTARSAIATLTGFGIDGYRLAINGLVARNLATKVGVTAKA